MWVIIYVVFIILWLLWRMVTLEMQLLLLPLDSTGGLRTVLYRLRHAVQAKAHAEQHKGEDEGKKQLGVPGGKPLHTGGTLIEFQGLGEGLARRHIFLVPLFVLRVILIGNFLPEQYFLKFHIVVCLIV